MYSIGIILVVIIVVVIISVVTTVIKYSYCHRCYLGVKSGR